MNLQPTVKELSQSITALQDYMNDAFKQLQGESKSVKLKPADFEEVLHNHFCDFLESTQQVESVLETTIEKMCSQYSDSYDKEHGLANVRYLDDYRKTKLTFTDAPEYIDLQARILKHPSMTGKPLD